MPQSRIDSAQIPPQQEVTAALDAFKRAESLGMEGEWMEWFIAGIRQGLSPVDAAYEASVEWDLL